MKWMFYVIVFVYMFYRAVYGAKDESKVLVEPIKYGKNSFWKTGSNQTVICDILNLKQEVEWKYPSGDVVTRDPNSRVFVRKNNVRFRGRTPSLVLNLRNVTSEDSGLYECYSDGDSDHALVCVIDPLKFVDTPTEVTVDMGRSITLSCQASGVPEPRIVWQRNGYNIDDETVGSKYKVMTKYNSQGFEGLLTIMSLEPDDSGLYTCSAIQESPHALDCLHNEYINITLNVNHAPIFENANETKVVYGNYNQSVNLECSASGYPAPTYRWFRDDDVNGLFEFSDKHLTLSEDESEVILTVVADSTTYGQKYKCQANNIYGDSDKYFTIMKMEKPMRPDEVALYNSTDKAAYFSVSYSEQLLFPVDGFDIQYLNVNDAKRGKLHPRLPADWKNSKIVKIDNEISISEPETEGILVTLSGLEAETEYWARLRATNMAGESSWSNSVFVKTSSTMKEELVAEKPNIATVVQSEVNSDATFYGIFFAGGILVVAAVCMFAMRMV